MQDTDGTRADWTADSAARDPVVSRRYLAGDALLGRLERRLGRRLRPSPVGRPRTRRRPAHPAS